VLSAKAKSFGGILLDSEGRVLLRKPRGNFDGYVWTFPKGRPDEGETPEEAALREVKEETGYSAKIISKLPGIFEGGTTVVEFYLMSPLGEPGSFDQETSEVRWATISEAAVLISNTINLVGRKRDLAVLEAVREATRPVGGLIPER